MAIPYATSEKQLDQLVKSSEALVVYFTASWCGPCQAIAPVVEKLYETYQNLQVYKVDIDANKQSASKHNITAVPTFIFFNKSNEVSRLRGANVQGIYEGFSKLSDLAPQAKREANSSTKQANSNEEFKQVQKYIPNGYGLLNGTVFFGEFETLNSVILDSDNKELQNIVRDPPQVEGKTSIVSDADSQLLLHIPLTNISKIYSILVKFKPGKFHDDELQRPNKVKIWSNRSSVISFDDATTLEAIHDEDLVEDKWDENGWYEIKLKFVRFQKVTSLDFFFDGDDEDEHTSIERILIIGVDGESKNQGKLEKLGE